MTKVKTRGNPAMWKARMLNNVTPTRQSSSILYTEPHKRRMTKDFDFVQPCGYVEDVEVDSLSEFERVSSNEAEARAFVALFNHQHLRKRTDRVITAELSYRESLRQFNLCGNCLNPLRVKRDAIKQGPSVDSLNDVTIEYADIPEHYRVYQHPTNTRKCVYQLVSKTRIFNQRCGCGVK
jgi:hypothetical protein